MTNPRKPQTDRSQSRAKGRGKGKGMCKGKPQAMPPQPEPVRADIRIERVLEPLLVAERKGIYMDTDKNTANAKHHFHRARRQLLHGLSWPAHWL